MTNKHSKPDDETNKYELHKVMDRMISSLESEVVFLRKQLLEKDRLYGLQINFLQNQLKIVPQKSLLSDDADFPSQRPNFNSNDNRSVKRNVPVTKKPCRHTTNLLKIAIIVL